MIYDPKTNLTGARCTYQDNMINVSAAGIESGFARRPFNVGVQYIELRALNEGKITVDQFVDLNRRVGGHDVDGNVVSVEPLAMPTRCGSRMRRGASTMQAAG